MNISRASDLSGLPAKTIRYYEEIGLITPDRHENGYRDFSETHVHKLTFLARGRELGFSVEDCRELLRLYEDHDRASADVRAIARTHLNTIADRINQLRAMQATLQTLVDSCAGDARPDCPILSTLADDPSEMGAEEATAGRA